MKYLAISATLALLAAFLGALVASANPYEGHPCDWAKDTPGVQLLLQQNWIAGDQVDICSSQFPASTQEGGRRWNDPTALNFSVFRYRSCDGYQDALAQTYSDFDATCGAGMHACVYPSAPDWAGYDMVPVGAGIAYIYMNPNISWPDNDAHTTRDITHELGHVLGLADISCSTYGDTLMSDSEGTCNFAYPQPIDINDYHILYHADPVQNVVASSPSPNTVNLSWSQIIAGTSYDIPNEKSFTIKRGDCGGSPTLVTTVPKNTLSKTLTSQPAGSYTYCIFSDSDADNQPVSDRSWWASNVVTVSDPVGQPDLVVLTPTPPDTNKNEGGTATFSVTIKNQGSAAAGPFFVDISFNGYYRPYPQGMYAFNDGLAAGAQQTQTVNAVNMDFAGGYMYVVADAGGQVAESDESNNSRAGGLLAVKPKAPTYVRAVPAYAAYAWTDQSAIEKRFYIELQRRTSCSSGTWSAVPGQDTEGHSFPYNHPALSGSGTDHIMLYGYTHSYCYRLRVTPKAYYGADGTTVTSSTIWYP